MNQMVIPVSPTSDALRMQVRVYVQAEVLSAEAVRRRANVWLLENVGNLLRAESPELVLGEQLTWRVDVVLTSPTRGHIGRVGRLEIDATAGAVLADKSTIQEILTHARALTVD